jgi:predicted nucleic acid-binding Zn ribbon protein
MSPVLVALLRGQPDSPARTEFAWRVAVGPAAARATTVTLDKRRVLHVEARDPHWRAELRRAAPMLQQRLAGLLGDEVVRRVTISRAPGGRAAPATTTTPPREAPG